MNLEFDFWDELVAAVTTTCPNVTKEEVRNRYNHKCELCVEGLVLNSDRGQQLLQLIMKGRVKP